MRIPLCEICGGRHLGHQGHVFASKVVESASNRKVVASNSASNVVESASNTASNRRMNASNRRSGAVQSDIRKSCGQEWGGVVVEADSDAGSIQAVVEGGEGLSGLRDRGGGLREASASVSKQRWGREKYNEYQREYMRRWRERV